MGAAASYLWPAAIRTVRVYFDRDTYVVIEIPAQGRFGFRDLSEKVAEEHSLQYPDVRKVEAWDLEFIYENQETGVNSALDDDADLAIALRSNPKLEVGVRVADRSEGPFTFDPKHNRLLEWSTGLKPGAVLAMYQSDNMLIPAAQGALLTAIRKRGDGQYCGFLSEALLIQFMTATEEVLYSYVSHKLSKKTRKFINKRKATWKEIYGEDQWQKAKDDVDRWLAKNPQPHNHNLLIDGRSCPAWFTKPHLQWLSRITGFTDSDILTEIFQDNDSIVARAKIALRDLPPEAFLAEVLGSDQEQQPQVIARQVRKQVFANGPPVTPLLNRRPSRDDRDRTRRDVKFGSIRMSSPPLWYPPTPPLGDFRSWPKKKNRRVRPKAPKSKFISRSPTLESQPGRSRMRVTKSQPRRRRAVARSWGD